MKKFRELTEAKNTIVFAFGRFNPPTTGHEKLIQKTASVAGSNSWRIYPSFTQNPKKDPLPHALKVAYMRKMFSKYKRNIIVDTDAKTAINIAVKLYDEGFKNLQMIAGSDRVKEFDSLLSKYNGVEGKRHGYYKFDTIEIVSAGERDPDSEGVEGMSASKMRAAAVDGDMDSFLKGVPSGFADSKKLYRDVRKYMGIREEKDMGDMSDFEYVRDQYLTGKIWNVGDVVESNGVVGEVVRKGTNYLSFVSEDGKVHKAWLYEINEDVLIEVLDILNELKGLTPLTIIKLQKSFGKIRKFNPDSQSGERIVIFIQDRSNDDLRAIIKAKIRHLSDLSKAELKRRGIREGYELDEVKSPLQKLRDFDKSRVAAGKKPIFKDKDVKFVKMKKKGLMTTMNVPTDEIDKYLKKGYKIVESLDERNYRKEYDNYQGHPEQIARRSSRNKARRVMGDKTKIGMDVGHKDNNPLNNDPKNLRNEDPSKNRREPRLRSEEESLDELHRESWYIKFSNWINTHAHKKEFGKLAKEYVNLVRSNKKYRNMPTRAISDVARGVQGVNSRELANYINDLVKKGVLPQDLKAEFDPSEEKISSFKSFIDQINNK